VSERRIGLACAFSVLLIWTGFHLSGRLSARQALLPWDLTALRFGGSFLAAMPLVAMYGWPRLRPWRAVALIATAAFGFPMLAYFGFGLAPAAHAGVVLAGSLPLLVAALSVLFLGERWTATRLLSLAVVAAGIALLFSDTFGAAPGAWRGDLFFLGSVLSWAIYTVLIRHWREPALRVTLAVAIYPAIVYLPLWWFVLPSHIAIAPVGVVVFQGLYQGIIAVLLAGFLFTRAVNAIGAGMTTSITALVPAMVALGGWVLLGEPLGPAGLAGVALVCLGMLLAVAGPGLRKADTSRSQPGE